MSPAGWGAALIGWAALKWWFRRPRRRLYVVNHEDYVYRISVVEGKKRVEVTLPAQHLPCAISFLERMSPKSPITLEFHSNAGAEHDNRLTLPPWAIKSVLRRLRRLRRTWQPRRADLPVVGPYR